MRLLLAWLGAAAVILAADARQCLPCHQKQVEAMRRSGMLHALMRPVESVHLPDGARYAAGLDGYSYEVKRIGERVLYTVRRGDESMERTLEWAFGAGHTGQTWAYRDNGQWVETRVSYYPQLKALHLTVGAANQVPSSLGQAAGRVMAPADAAECFGCHSSGGVEGARINFAALRPGIGCEACHGEAAPHVAALRANARDRKMRNPGRASTEEISTFCGQCHRTWEQVMLMRVKGINTIRFQPYRLTQSKCYDVEDARISCVACHDPHATVEPRAEAYDAKCTACHDGGARKRCAAGHAAACSTCHMPKLPLPGAHADFTDHRIRVWRRGDAFPD